MSKFFRQAAHLRQPALNPRPRLAPRFGTFGLLLALPSLLASPPAIGSPREPELQLQLLHSRPGSSGGATMPGSAPPLAFDPRAYATHLRTVHRQRQAPLPAGHNGVAGVLHWPSISLRPEELITDQ